MTTPIEPPPAGTVFTKDPVRITTAIFVLVQGLIAILTAAEAFGPTLGGVLMACVTVAWGAVNLLFVEPATVPRQPLAELAYEASTHPPGPVTPTSPVDKAP